jgi:hypothetical protein
MNEKMKTFSLLAIVLVTGLALVTAYTLVSNSVLAVSKSKTKSTSSSTSSSSSSKGSSGKLKSLVSCETTSAKAAANGEPSQNQVLGCYSQAYGNATGTTNSTVSTLGTGGNSSSSTNGGGSGSSSSGSGASSTSSSHKSHHGSSSSSTK